MEPVYEHVSKGRRPASLAAAGVTFVLVVLGAIIGAPWWIQVICLTLGAGAAWFLWVSPTGRLRIDDQAIWVRAKGFRGSWPLDEIERVEIATWSDGPDTCRLDFGHGQTVLLPEDALPPSDELAAALAARQIRVKRL